MSAPVPVRHTPVFPLKQEFRPSTIKVKQIPHVKPINRSGLVIKTPARRSLHGAQKLFKAISHWIKQHLHGSLSSEGEKKSFLQ